MRLRDRVFAIEKGRLGETNADSYLRMIEVVRDENTKLKNELSILRSERGSQEIIASYKEEIDGLRRRNLDLEQRISDLTAELANFKKEN